jgi:hypothetical protein
MKEIIYLNPVDEQVENRDTCNDIIRMLQKYDVARIAFILKQINDSFEKAYGVKVTVIFKEDK